MGHKTSGLKIATYLNIFLGVIFIAASLLIVIAVNHSMRKQALAGARAKTHLLLERNMATHHYFSNELKPKLFEKLKPTTSDNYFEPAWMSSTYAIRQIDKHFKSFGKHEDYYYKECAVNARSPQNEADDYEKAFIAELNANPDLLNRSETRTIDDEKYYVTLHRGETMHQSCIRGHDTPEKAPAEMLAKYGPERSFGRKAGDVVSAVSIRIPLAKAFAATKAISIKISGLLVVILSVIFTMQFFFTKWLIQKPLGILQNKSFEISSSDRYLGDKLPLPRGRELRSLVTAFNNMSTNLRHNRDTLQEQVKNRTDEIVSLTQQYKELVENTDNLITRVDKDGKFLYVNQTVEKILGLPPEECIGLSAFDFIHPDDLERTKHIFATKRQEKSENITLENRQVSRSGQTRHMLWTCTPHFDESGKIAWIDSIARDITKRKQAEEALRLSEEKFSKLVQTSKEAVNIISADYLITYTNEFTDKLFGYEKGELLGQNVEILNAPSVRKGMEKDIIESINKKGWWEGEIVNIRKDGTEFISSATISASKDSDGNILSYNTIQHDITDIKRDAEQLKQAKEQAEAANIAKSHFLANMSHEIRTPMSVILGFTELLANKKLPKEQADHVELIQNAGKGLLQVINDVLDVSKIEAGKLDINMTDCSLNKILDDIKTMIKSMATKKGLQFNILKGENIPTAIHTDHDRLAQCLVNLISNAIKFTEKGHVHLKVSLDTKNNSLIRFDVEDTGIGIEPGKLQSVFESFTQVDNTCTRQQTGTGLGLTITKRLTELLGGTVSVSSHAGKGSVFSLVIPEGIDLLAQAQIQQTPSTSEIPLDANTRQFNGKVLIAEDYEGLREYAKTLLQSFGMKTTLAADGQEAVKTALSDSFDLILMDLRMPNMDGYQAVKELRDKDNKTPIIAVTAHAMRGYKKICLSKGFDDYISKPIDSDQMSDILDKYLPAEKKHRQDLNQKRKRKTQND